MNDDLSRLKLMQAAGVKLVPMLPGKKQPVAKGWLDAPPTPWAEIKKHVERGGNVARVCGDPDRNVLIDLDPGSPDGLELPGTLSTHTPRGGRHFHYQWPEGVPLPSNNNNGRLAPHVDVKSAKGLAMLPPSKTEDGPYIWADWREAAPAPAWIVERMTPAPRKARGKYTPRPATDLTRECEAVATEPEGHRNDRLNLAAYNLGAVVAAGALDEATVRANLEVAAEAAGLDESDAAATIASGLTDGQEAAQAPGGRVEPVPLQRAVDPAKPYPVADLGETLGGAVRALCEAVQVPEAMAANAVLAVAATGAQYQVDIEIDGRRMPCSLFAVTVARSGDRKSATDRLAQAPLAEAALALRDTWTESMRRHAADHAAWTAARAELLRKHKGSPRPMLAQMLDAVGPEPDRPPRPVLVASDFTTQGVHAHLARDWPTLLLSTSEGGVLLGGYSMNKDNVLATIAAMSGWWDGCLEGARLRGGDGFTEATGRRVSAHLMAQPEVIDKLLGSDIVDAQGLSARLLVAWPESRMGERLYRAQDVRQDPRFVVYHERMREILEEPLQWADPEDHGKGLALRVLRLTPEARALWTAFHDEIETRLRGDLEGISSWGAKAAEHAARIAGVLALVDATQAVSGPVMAGAIELTRYYLGEAARAKGLAVVDRVVTQQAQVLEFVQSKGGRATASEIMSTGPAWVRTGKALQEVMSELVAGGHLLYEVKQPKGGGRAQRAWRLAV